MSNFIDQESKDPEEILQEAVEIRDFISLFGLPSIIHASADKDAPENEKEQFIMSQYTGTQVIGKTRSQIYSLLEENMQELFIASNWGWDEESKRKELFHALSRFLVVKDSKDKVAAFVTFRFEWDDEDEPEYPVLFLYEIQVSEDHRGKQLGSILLSYLKTISSTLGLAKILLTCFKANIAALRFYERNGFGIDANSPSACGFHDEAHELLSDRPIKR